MNATHLWRVKINDSLLKPTRTGIIIVQAGATPESAIAAARQTDAWAHLAKGYGGSAEINSVEFLGTLDN
jgi:alkanesulfonate monooxygenase SsuD/methylene tetrahydromethanopterin reductase-like flavin-dependent oxidoreductase (luciferase family)